MSRLIRKSEIMLLLACLILLVLAGVAPPLPQHAHYHQFADQRSWLGIPHAMDVLGNLPFAMLGMAGLACLWCQPAKVVGRAQYLLAALFFSGLVLTAFCSAAYHWRPDDARLALDRSGMVVAFAGLLGLAVAGHLSARSGMLLALAVLVLGPLSVWIWSATGNVLPWGLLQFSGMVLLLVLARVKVLAGALAIRWGVLIIIYAAAKVLELEDQAVYELGAQLVSGHSLKHVVAAFAAWPVISALLVLRQNPAGSATGVMTCAGRR
jgi:hypothetical protein